MAVYQLHMMTMLILNKIIVNRHKVNKIEVMKTLVKTANNSSDDSTKVQNS